MHIAKHHGVYDKNIQCYLTIKKLKIKFQKSHACWQLQPFPFIIRHHGKSYIRWSISIIPALGKLKQEDHHRFKASSSYIVHWRPAWNTEQVLVSNENKEKDGWHWNISSLSLYSISISEKLVLNNLKLQILSCEATLSYGSTVSLLSAMICILNIPKGLYTRGLITNLWHWWRGGRKVEIGS